MCVSVRKKWRHHFVCFFYLIAQNSVNRFHRTKISRRCEIYFGKTHPNQVCAITSAKRNYPDISNHKKKSQPTHTRHKNTLFIITFKLCRVYCELPTQRVVANGSEIAPKRTINLAFVPVYAAKFAFTQISSAVVGVDFLFVSLDAPFIV